MKSRNEKDYCKTSKDYKGKEVHENTIGPCYIDSCRYPSTFRLWGCSTCSDGQAKYCWDHEINCHHG